MIIKLENHDASWHVLPSGTAYTVIVDSTLGHTVRYAVYPETIAIEHYGSGKTLWSAARHGQTLEQAERTLDRALKKAIAKLTVVRP